MFVLTVVGLCGEGAQTELINTEFIVKSQH